jgi:hypothetical protein
MAYKEMFFVQVFGLNSKNRLSLMATYHAGSADQAVANAKFLELVWPDLVCHSYPISGGDMEDVTREIEAIGKRYWIRWYDAEVTDVQGYNVGSTNVRVTNNFNHYHNFGNDQTVSVQSNSDALNRVFFRNGRESNFFDVNVQSFAAAPGHHLRVTYIGPIKNSQHSLGYLSFARNVTNGSVIGFDFWHAFVPSTRVAKYLFIAALVIFCISVILEAASGGGGGGLLLTGIIAAAALTFLIVQESKRSSAIKKIWALASENA